VEQLGGPEGNRTPYSSMPWRRVTGIPQAQCFLSYQISQKFEEEKPTEKLKSRFYRDESTQSSFDEWTYRESNSELRNANAPVYHLPISPFLEFSSRSILS
jgi:hypothetical protein